MAQRIAWAFLGRRETNSVLKRRSCMQRLMSFAQCAWTTRIALPRWRLWFRTDARSTVFPCFFLENARSVLKPEVKKVVTPQHAALLCFCLCCRTNAHLNELCWFHNNVQTEFLSFLLGFICQAFVMPVCVGSQVGRRLRVVIRLMKTPL